MSEKALANIISKAKIYVFEDGISSFESIPSIDISFPNKNRMTRKQANKFIVPALRRTLKNLILALQLGEV